MGLGKSIIDKWTQRLKEERNGNLTSAVPLTYNQLRELERKLKRLEPRIDN